MELNHINDLSGVDFATAGVPIFTHPQWLNFNGVVPRGIFCITRDRNTVGEDEYFIGDGIHKYEDLPKFGGFGGSGTSNYLSLINKPQISNITLTGNKSLDDLGAQKNNAKLKADFVAQFGSITLLDNPIADWQFWIAWAQNKLSTEGNQHFYAPYSDELMVDLYVDPVATYPLVWSMKDSFYGKNASGITRLGASDAVLKSELSETVLNMLYYDIIECGIF